MLVVVKLMAVVVLSASESELTTIGPSSESESTTIGPSSVVVVVAVVVVVVWLRWLRANSMLSCLSSITARVLIFEPPDTSEMNAAMWGAACAASTGIIYCFWHHVILASWTP
jgi:hypothetical protein